MGSLLTLFLGPDKFVGLRIRWLTELRLIVTSPDTPGNQCRLSDGSVFMERQGNLSGKGEAGGRRRDVSEDLQRLSESSVQVLFRTMSNKLQEVSPGSGGSCSESPAGERPEQTSLALWRPSGVSSGGNFLVFVERLEM